MASNRIKALANTSEFGKKIVNYYDFISWCRWFPDLMLDMLKPKKGGLNLHLDQRIFLRCDVRFFSLYGDFSRGYAKTFNEVLSAVVVAMLYPNVTIAISAQTKENAADLLATKWNEIIKFYPLIENELLEKPKFQRGVAVIKFKSGSEIDAIANAQSTKG
jgi:ribonucleoside-diphosphate reductase alpha chain